MFRTALSRSLLVAATTVAVACNSTMMDSTLGTQLLSVSPRGGAVGVSTMPDIVLTFTRPMMPGMERYTALHQGGPTGPTMPMSCAWSDGQKALTCRPDQPLTPVSPYTIHMGGGMMDADDRPVGMGGYGMDMGGNWATGTMMGGQTGMMGSGWMHTNGSYGMVFGFTTR